MSDSTHDKQADRLIESEQRYRALFENMTAGFVLFEVVQDDRGTPVDLTILAANRGFETSTGLKVREVTGKRLSRVLPGIENDAADWIGTYGGIALTGESRQFERGSELLGVAYSIMAYQAAPGQCAVTFVDITGRKKAEKERERLLTAIEQTVDMVVITDPDGTIRYVNPAFEAVTGYTSAEILGRKPSILKSGKQDQADYRRLWETITGGGTWQGTFVNRRKDGSLYNEESTISPVTDSKGQIVSYVAVKRDISELLTMSREKAGLEEELLQARRLESVGRLAGGIAHDFNNMLSVILGFGESLLDQIHAKDPMREDVEAILEAGRRSAALTHQLLAFSRKQTLQPQVLDLNEIVRGLETMLRRLIGEHIELEFSLAQEPGRVFVDPAQLEQVIVNLAVNARDAMQAGGGLRIETRVVDLDRAYAESHPGVSAGRHVRIAITDSGCGMPDAVKKQVFEPFFTTKKTGVGTGLGLATVYGIVKQSGGHIWVDSELDRGTTFEIYFPESEPVREPEEREDAEAAPETGSEHILVVEDEESLGKLIGKLLRRLGYEVTVVANGGEALLLMEEKGVNPDLIVTDVVMPMMSGKELVDRLKKNRPDLKVLYMSGYTNDAIVQHGVLDPGTAFVQKPFTSRQIAARIQAVLSGDSP